MSSWITITLGDLNDARVAALVDALRKEELGAGQTDPMPRRIQTVIDEIRRSIAKCPSTPIDADTTKIPPGLRDMAVEEIIGRLKKRLLQPLSDDEVRAEKRYWEILAKLQTCAWPVDRTDNPIALDPVRPSGGVQIATSTGRKATRSKMAGL